MDAKKFEDAEFTVEEISLKSDGKSAKEMRGLGVFANAAAGPKTCICGQQQPMWSLVISSVSCEGPRLEDFGK
jgi:hypothetical protein